MSDAFHSANRLATAILRAWAGERPYAEAMHDYETTRNDHAGPLYARTCRLATLDDLPYYRRCAQKIITTRQRLSEQLTELGFDVLPSVTNFIFAKPPELPAKVWLAELRKRKILVRWFDYPATRDRLRITIGTDGEARAVVRAAREILA